MKTTSNPNSRLRHLIVNLVSQNNNKFINVNLAAPMILISFMIIIFTVSDILLIALILC